MYFIGLAVAEPDIGVHGFVEQNARVIKKALGFSGVVMVRLSMFLQLRYGSVTGKLCKRMVAGLLKIASPNVGAYWEGNQEPHGYLVEIQYRSLY